MEEFIGTTRKVSETMLEVAEDALSTRAALSEVHTELAQITSEIAQATKVLAGLNARYEVTYQKAGSIVEKTGTTARSVATAHEVLQEALNDSASPHAEEALRILGALAAHTDTTAVSTDLALDKVYDVINVVLPTGIERIEEVPDALKPSVNFLGTAVDDVAKQGGMAFEVRDELQRYIASVTGQD